MSNRIYRLIAYRGGKKVILAEYRGDDTGLYYFQIERMEKGVETELCCKERCAGKDMSSRPKTNPSASECCN